MFGLHYQSNVWITLPVYCLDYITSLLFGLHYQSNVSTVSSLCSHEESHWYVFIVKHLWKVRTTSLLCYEKNPDDSRINPFTATACKISRLKSAHIHPSKQYSWCSYSKSTVNTVNPTRVHVKEARKPEWFDIWHFYWSFSQWQRSKHGSERVNPV